MLCVREEVCVCVCVCVVYAGCVVCVMCVGSVLSVCQCLSLCVWEKVLVERGKGLGVCVCGGSVFQFVMSVCVCVLSQCVDCVTV